jgi:glycosyltransferase involved in cell wall biosynthesis
MIEAMACGTPVIAWNCGAIPEVIEDGITGFIVNSEDEALAAIERIAAIERRGIRAVFEQRFTATLMARAYLDVYAQLLNRRPLRRAS